MGCFLGEGGFGANLDLPWPYLALGFTLALLRSHALHYSTGCLRGLLLKMLLKSRPAGTKSHSLQQHLFSEPLSC